MNRFLLFIIIVVLGYVGYWVYQNIFQGDLFIFFMTLGLVTGSILYYQVMVQQ